MPRPGRTRGRRGRAAAQEAAAEPRAPYIQRKIPPYQVLADADLAIIEANAETILEEIGIDIKDDAETRDIFAAAGASVDGDRVRFPRGMCREIIQTDRSETVHSIRAQSGEQCRDRRQ